MKPLKRGVGNSARAALFGELASHFAADGWDLEGRPKSTLNMVRLPSAGVEHRLLIYEPFRAKDLPSPGMMGIGCVVNTHFQDVEQVINEVMGHDSARVGKFFLALNLGQLVPEHHVLARTAHLVTPDAASDGGVSCFLGDFKSYLEPHRRRLESVRVFEDKDYVPPGISPWTWKVRQAAYARMALSIKDGAVFLDRLEGEADRALKPVGGVRASDETVFNSGEELRADLLRRGATELREFIAAARVH